MTTTLDEVWALFREVAEAQKQTSQDIDRVSHTVEELGQEVGRVSHTVEELGQKLEQVSQENQRVNRQLSKQLGELGGKWGLFVENMVAPACENLFVSRGIPVHEVSQRTKRRRQGETLEMDVLVTNAGHVLVVEVKSTLGVEDIRDFVVDLGHFKTFFPEHRDKVVYGAVAGIVIDDGADRYAYRQGLFVLAQSGESIAILNGTSFQPKAW